MTFIIHGATGAQGGPLIKRLLAAGKPALAAVRNASSTNGLPTVVVNNASVDSLAAAYRGADGVFFHLPLASEEDRVQYAHNFAQAIALARPARVVISTSGNVVDEPGAATQVSDDSAIAVLLREVARTGVSFAVVAPRLYLENLLLPTQFGAVQAEGVLRYPLRADYPVSWSSHLDVAVVAERLLADAAISGIVGLGHAPGLTGADLALRGQRVDHARRRFGVGGAGDQTILLKTAQAVGVGADARQRLPQLGKALQRHYRLARCIGRHRCAVVAPYQVQAQIPPPHRRK